MLNKTAESSSELVLMVRIEAKPEHVDSVKDALLALTASSQAESGCVQYDLHRDNANPAVFYFYEIWASYAAWQEHMQTAHLQAAQAALKETTASTVVSEMTVVK